MDFSQKKKRMNWTFNTYNDQSFLNLGFAKLTLLTTQVHFSKEYSQQKLLSVCLVEYNTDIVAGIEARLIKTTTATYWKSI